MLKFVPTNNGYYIIFNGISLHATLYLLSKWKFVFLQFYPKKILNENCDISLWHLILLWTLLFMSS